MDSFRNVADNVAISNLHIRCLIDKLLKDTTFRAPEASSRRDRSMSLRLLNKNDLSDTEPYADAFSARNKSCRLAAADGG
jgi:hypothetical protein